MKKNLKILKIIGIIIGVLIILILILAKIAVMSDKGRYYGSENPITGEWCDYGFHPDYQMCCDEDDWECEVCTWKDYDCSDFTTQEKAQSVYDLCENFNEIRDVHGLDMNNDGIACENLK